MEDDKSIQKVIDVMKEYTDERRDEQIRELLLIEQPKEEKPIVLGESWLTTGNCKTCRRKKYCSTQCKANKRRKDNIITNMVLDSMIRVMTGKK